MDTAGMIAGAAANERGIRAGPHGGDLVLLLVVEKVPGFPFSSLDTSRLFSYKVTY